MMEALGLPALLVLLADTLDDSLVEEPEEGPGEGDVVIHGRPHPRSLVVKFRDHFLQLALSASDVVGE